MAEAKYENPDFFKSLNSFAKAKHETLWLASRFLPNKAERQRALAIMCLDGEFNRIASISDEEIVSQIRLQWWRDEIERLENGQEPQQTDAALSLAYLIANHSHDKSALLLLIDAYDDIISQNSGAYGEALFNLFVSDESAALAAGRVFQSANQGQLPPTSIEELTAHLESVSDADWPWLALFVFTEHWLTRKKIPPLQKRWRYWVGFAKGEGALKSKLEALSARLQAVSS